MRKIISLMVAALLFVGLVGPALAAENVFVPSISYKYGPDIEEAVLGDQNVTGCLVVTSITGAREKTTDIYREDRDLLLDAYKQLEDGSVKLPLDEDYVIRELVDVSWKQTACVEEKHTHDEDLKKEAVTVTIDLELGIDANTDLLVYAYRNGQWEPIESAKNNGDGTITCVFEHFCPVAFAVREQTGGSETGDTARGSLILWGVLMVVSLTAVVVLTINRKKHTR